MLLTILGTLINIAGAFFLARNFLISKDAAIELGMTRIVSEIRQENVKLPAVKGLLEQRRDAIIGLCLTGLGITLTVIASMS
jgi:hypothetical protein